MKLVKLIKQTRGLYIKSLGLNGFVSSLSKVLLTKNQCVTVSRPELEHPIELRFFTSDVATYKQVITDDEYLFDTHSTPKTIIDAGANIGLTSVYLANKFPKATII